MNTNLSKNKIATVYPSVTKHDSDYKAILDEFKSGENLGHDINLRIPEESITLVALESLYMEEYVYTTPYLLYW
ncbi:hypothetical protein TNCV_3527591 [Trichonephila clavipes]|nr:hypothetical protein TNCV_3527591 [Trichonephila clavipes]